MPHNEVEIYDLFAQDLVSGVDIVEPLNLNEGKKGQFVVMYSGVLGLGYDFDVVLEAARILRENVFFH